MACGPVHPFLAQPNPPIVRRIFPPGLNYGHETEEYLSDEDEDGQAVQGRAFEGAPTSQTETKKKSMWSKG